MSVGIVDFERLLRFSKNSAIPRDVRKRRSLALTRISIIFSGQDVHNWVNAHKEEIDAVMNDLYPQVT